MNEQNNSSKSVCNHQPKKSGKMINSEKLKRFVCHFYQFSNSNRSEPSGLGLIYRCEAWAKAGIGPDFATAV